MKKFTSTLLALSLSVPGLALAADDEITMQVIDGDTPEAVAQQIELPEAPPEQARTRSAAGVETANQSRERNRNRVREAEQENEEALRERRREMHEQRQQMQEQRQEMQQQMMEQQDGTRDAMQSRQGQ